MDKLYKSSDQGSITDHFDGVRFYNNPKIAAHGLVDVIKWKLSPRLRGYWPQWVDTKRHESAQLKVNNDQLRITLINHATVLVQTPSFNILTDPIYSERCSPLPWFGPKRVRSPGIAFEQLPHIDVVLISHNHYDHLDLRTLKRLFQRDQPLILVGLQSKKLFDDHAITNVEELDWWQSVTMSTHLTVTFVPAQHFSGRGLFDRYKTLWGGFVLGTPIQNIYFSGDTGYGPHFSAIFKRFGSMNIALLPIGAYTPRTFMASVHMSPEDAVLAHLDLGTKTSIGMHYGTFQLTDESMQAPLVDLEKAMVKHAIPAQAFITPDIGVPITIY